jgi:hypothetical protein
MKKLLVAIMVLALVALTVPVWAENNSVSDPQCNVSLDANVYLLKLVLIAQLRADLYFTGIFTCFEPAARADAEVVKNDLNSYNEITYDPQFCGNSSFEDTMTGSFSNFNGIGQSNQSAGSMNNQGNVVAVAYVSNAQTYASSLAAVGDTNTQNNIQVNYGRQENDGPADRFGFNHYDPVLTQTDKMNDSFNRFTGIGQSNQSAGSLNNQNNVVAIAAGVGEKSRDGYQDSRSQGRDFGSSVAVAAAELALNNTCNKFCVDKVTFTNTMTGSFNGFTGIGQSNQSAGNMNNQVNVISVAASVKINP